MKRLSVFVMSFLMLGNEILCQNLQKIDGLVKNIDNYKVPYQPVNNIFQGASDIVFGKVVGLHYRGICLNINKREPLLDFEILFNESMMPSVQISYFNNGDSHLRFFRYEKDALIEQIEGDETGVYYNTFNSLGELLSSDYYDNLGESLNGRVLLVNDSVVNPIKSFNMNGQPINESYFGLNSTIIKYNYDDVGRIQTISIDDRLVRSFNYSEIDKFGNWTKLKYSLPNGNLFEITRQLFYDPSLILTK